MEMREKERDRSQEYRFSEKYLTIQQGREPRGSRLGTEQGETKSRAARMTGLFWGHSHPTWTVPRGSQGRETFREAGSGKDGWSPAGRALKTLGECPHPPG